LLTNISKREEEKGWKNLKLSHSDKSYSRRKDENCERAQKHSPSRKPSENPVIS